MSADPSNPNSVCLLDVGQGGSSLRWDHGLSTRSLIKGGQKLQTYIYLGWFLIFLGAYDFLKEDLIFLGTIHFLGSFN